MKRNFSYGARKAAKPAPLSNSEIKTAIASIVRCIDLQGFISGGTCFPRCLIGSIVMARFGVPNKIVFGGMLYRTGREPYDIVAFCGPDNRGHHPGLFHSWIEAGEDLIDFSSGDWRETTSQECEVNPLDLPPLNWLYPPPSYIWRPRAPLLAAWRPAPNGPAPGCVWYGPIAEIDKPQLCDARNELLPILIPAIDRVMLEHGLPVFKIQGGDGQVLNDDVMIFWRQVID